MNIDKSHKKDFAIFDRKVLGKTLHYLDSAATSQICNNTLSAINEYEISHRANVHRGVHTLSEESSQMYENSRKTVASFINAVVPEEVVFTKNTTESINLLAHAWGRKNISEGDIILLSEVEHHSNLIPWQVLAKEKNAELKFISISDDGQLQINHVDVDWSKVKLVSFVHVSNVLGVINDVKDIVKSVKKKYTPKDDLPRFFIDAAQSVPHMNVNVQKLGVDFIAFSGHKMCGPMGIGVLWINRDAFSEFDVYQTGGGMIHEVDLYSAEYAKIPQKLEAGTPNVSGAVGLAAACNYLESIGLDNIYQHEKTLTKYMVDSLSKIDDLVIYGTVDENKKLGVVSFNVRGIPSHDLAAIVDTEGVAIRSGHHCVMPWHMKQEITTTARASLYLYNDERDIDALVVGIKKAQKLFR